MTQVENKYTPEPWEEGYNAPLQVAHGGRVIGSFRREADREHANNCVNYCKGINPKAVPKMLKALRRIVEKICDETYMGLHDGDTRRIIQAAQDAIALAEKQHDKELPDKRTDG